MPQVVCAKCGEPPSDPSEVEPTRDGKWMHQKCMGSGYSLNFVDWIKARIAVTRYDEDEDRYKFVIRELVQNADDVMAQILVLRFEKDALYVANDGRAFSTVGPEGTYEGSDFDRSSRVLKRFKEYDKESTGHFGSGFQTVYAITNHPEVHSNAACRALNPVNQEWDDLEVRLRSPYAGGPIGKKGVLFRLPWRDEKAANEVVNKENKETPFAAKDFDTWNPKDTRPFYDGLKGYLADVMLFCQWLRAIRIVWNADARPEAYQAERDYQLHDLLPRPEVVEIRQGPAKEGGTWYKWDPRLPVQEGMCPPSFDPKSWEYQAVESRRYVAASRAIADKAGSRLMLLLGAHGTVRVDSSKSAKDKEIKKNHVHILFPLFQTKKAYLCSVIPLPSRGKNYFAFSSHLVPIESRTGVDIQGNEGVNGEWYRAAMLSLVALYREAFPRFLEAVKQMKLIASESQSLVLQSIPRGEIREWMQTGGGDVLWGGQETNELKDWIFEQSILVTAQGQWRSPAGAFHVAEETERRVVESLHLAAMPQYFTSKLDDIQWLKTKAEEEEFAPEDFVEAWTIIQKGSQFRYGKLAAANQSVRMDKSTVEAVLRYALSDAMGDRLSKLSLVPDSEGEFRDLASFPKLPPELKEMSAILSPSRRIHGDFVPLVEALEKVRPRRQELGFTEVPKIIDTEYRQQPERFASMEDGDHRLLSKIVARVVTHPTWAIDKGLGMFFVPCDFAGVMSLGEPPDVRKWPEHEGEHYTREWTFDDQPFDVPGLSAEVRSRVRILDLKGVADEERKRVSTRLSLVALAENPRKPTNFVRNFISPRLGSLFEDKTLADFLETDDPGELESQKKLMLEAIRVYFDKPHEEGGVKPGDMGKVPCLYGTDGVWRPARKFARGGGPLLERLGLYPLHPDFASETEWSNKTLEALEVTVQLDEASVVESLKKMAAEHPPDRKMLGDLFGTIITEFDSKRLAAISADLKQTAWIPVGIKDVAKASDAMFPSAERTEVLGESYKSFVDLSAMDADLRKRLEGIGEDGSNRAFNLGLRTRPSLPEMTEALNASISTGKTPPIRLQAELSKALPGTAREREEWKRGLGNPSLYWEGKWYTGSSIRLIEKTEDFPVPYESVGLLVLSPDDAHEIRQLADAVGAKTVVQTEDVANAICYVAGKVRSSPSSWSTWRSKYEALWKWLDDNQGEIPEVGKQFENEMMVFAAGSWHVPARVIIDDNDTANSPVDLGEWCVLPKAAASVSAMERMGAWRSSRLTEQAAADVLGTLRNGTPLDAQSCAVVLGLISISMEKGWAERTGPVPWPTSVARELKLSMPKDAFVGNQSLLALFSAIPQVVTGSEGNQRAGLGSLAERWSAQPLDGRVSYPENPFSQGGRATEMEAVLSEVYTRAVTFNPGDWEALACLHGIEVWRAGKTIQSYALGRYVGRFTVPAIVPVGKGRVTLLVRKDLDSLDKATADALVAWAVGEGLPLAKKDAMVKALLDSYKEREEAIEYDPVAQRLRPGYPETFRSLKSWYPGCQLCGEVTPKDDRGFETAENIRSMILSRGGLFRGDPGAYEPANSLYLCPRHAILLDRGLVRLGFMKGWETNREKVIKSLRETESRIPEDGSMFEIEVDVFEWTWQSGAKQASSEKQDWKIRPLKLTPEHAKAVLDKLIKYVGARQ